MLTLETILIAKARAAFEQKKVYIYKFDSFYFVISEDQRDSSLNGECTAIIYPNGEAYDCTEQIKLDFRDS